ncbi:MAG: hypothetical protein IH859_00640 [Chloroflexi bacterium]|nr:hypothetical protein [Chloroflexota bacterium]
MSDDKKIIPNKNDGFFEGVANYFKLVYRLMIDARVSIVLKVIPFLSLVYWISPFDIPLPIDDAAVIWGLTYLFIELCPQDVVAKHREAINSEIFAKWADSNPTELDEDDIIDADYKDEDPQ